MHTVFRIGEIKQIDSNNSIYQVKLQLTSDDDPQLRALTEHIREETPGSTGWKRLGQLLFKIGQYNKTEELYTALLEQTTDEGEKASYYFSLDTSRTIIVNMKKHLKSITKILLQTGQIWLLLMTTSVWCIET